MITINIDNIGAKVRSTPLTGLSTASGGVIVDTDTVLQAFGKLQHQITNIPQTNPGGSTRQVQFNNGGVFGGSPELTFFGTNRLSIGYAAPVDAGYRLDVNGSVRVLGSIGSGSPLFRIESDGRIFAGTNINTGNLLINANLATGGSNTYNIGIGLRENPQRPSVGGIISIGIMTEAGIVNARGSIAIGAMPNVLHDYAVALGFRSTSTASHQFIAGDEMQPLANVFFGSGPQGRNVYLGPGFSYTINGSGARGSNFAGGNLTLAGGKPTGNGLSGDVIFSTATTGASGTTLRNLTDRWAIKGDTGHLQALGAFNILLDKTTGSKIGGAGALLALYDNTPIAQPTTVIGAATLVGGGGTNITDTDTFDGYTLGQVVKALRDLGALT